jgi:hypothetical protein
MWSDLVKFDAPSKNAVLALAQSENVFGRIMTELAKATKESFCQGVKVIKPTRGHGSGRGYEVIFDPKVANPSPYSSCLLPARR